MGFLFSEIKESYSGLFEYVSAKDTEVYTTVLDRNKPLACLANAEDLIIYGKWNPEKMYIMADDTLKRYLILGPSPEEINAFLAQTGSRLCQLQLLQTDARHLKLPDLPKLINLKLNDNRLLETVSAVSAPAVLKSLNLSDTALTTLDSFPLPESLEILRLKATKLQDIPVGIQRLTKLMYLDLSYLELQDIPAWFPEFHLLDNPSLIQLTDIRVRGELLQTIGLSSTDLRDLLRTKCGPGMREYRVMLLGDAEAGKTLTLQRLLKDPAPPFDHDANVLPYEKDVHTFDDKVDDYVPEGFTHDSTPGVYIQDRDFDLSRYGMGNEQIRVHFWDFGGQDILHAVHSAFLSDKSLYVILLNTRNDTQDARARYWLRYLDSHKPGCPVLLVLNKIDQNPNASLDEYSLKRRYPNICGVVPLSSLKYNRPRFCNSFTKVLLKTLLAFDDLTFVFPARYNDVRAQLKNKKDSWISCSSFWKMCSNCDSTGVNPTLPGERKQERIALRQLISDLGIGLYYDISSRQKAHNILQTNTQIILRPTWLTNAIYTILINKHSSVTNGLISVEEIQQLLDPDNFPSQARRMVYHDEDYSDKVGYILAVMELKELAFLSEKDGMVFIPMLCERNTIDSAKDFEAEGQDARDDRLLWFRYTFDSLPSPVLFKILAALFKDADDSRIWLTGGLFDWKDRNNSNPEKLKYSVLLTAEDHQLDIRMLRYCDTVADAADKMDELIDTTIDGIVRDLNPTRLIGLRFNNYTEFFDRDLLKRGLRNGLNVTYSQYRDSRVYVDDILAYCDNSSSRMRDSLLADILEVCAQIQDNYLYYDCHEDNRNDYVSNSLSNRDYITHPQKRCGYGKGRSKSGEIDIEINSPSGARMSLYEGLNIKITPDLSDWRDHLDKLVTNYDMGGLPYLFLVCYAEDKSDNGSEFQATYNKYYRYICEYPPEGYTWKQTPCLREEKELSSGAYRRVVEAEYCSEGRDVRVYHLFIRFWNPNPKETSKKTAKKAEESAADPES